jgi:hypothetical protein
MGLSEDLTFGFHYWDWTHDPSSDVDFFSRLSDLTVQSDLPDTAWDYRVFVNAGPFSLAQGETLRVFYGVAAGADLDQLCEAAQAMISLYESFGARENQSYISFPESTLHLRPNPTRGILHCAVSTPGTSDFSIEIFDVSGRSMMRFGPLDEKDVVLDLRNLGPGVYFLQLKAGDLRTSRRVLKIY